jgi:hypothetical protein
MTEPALAPERAGVPDHDCAADEAIALCGGDARQAVRELLISHGLLESELEMARATNSYGFTRGWHHRRRGHDAA